MPPETEEAASATPETTSAVPEAPHERAYRPPDHEPQGLDPQAEAEAKTHVTPAEPKAKILPGEIKPPKSTGGFRERLGELARARDEARQEAAWLRQQLERTSQARETQKKPAANGEITPDDFETYAEYVDALVERKIALRDEANKSQRAHEQFASYQQERETAFNKYSEPLAKEYGEGYWDAITDPTLQVSEPMYEAVMDLGEVGPVTMLWLASHRDEAARIARLSPRAATLEIGKLAYRIDAEMKNGSTPPDAAPAAPPATRPSVVNVPRGTSPAVTNSPSDKDSVDEWLRKETDRLRRVNPNARFYGAR
jgi:hypothetical protein